MARVTQPKPDKPITPKHAWQPLTPRGIAAFAHASGARSFSVQFIVASIVVATCLWFVSHQLFPVITDAIQALPGESAVQNGRWITTNDTPRRLAGNRWLEIILDRDHRGGITGAADLSVILTARSFRFCGVLGCFELPHEGGYTFTISRGELGPMWEAWRQPAHAILAVSIFLFLFVSWWVLGLGATALVKLIAFFSDRQVTWSGSWRVGNAALLPGALVVAVGIAFYALNAIDLFQLGLFYALHLICDVLFVVGAPAFLPKLTPIERAKNPFDTAPKETSSDAQPKKPNPFRAP
jgi:hypothetical protein